ncbi:hypothetical protein FE257_007711 [Aspergillus nanangensis]|uniref:G-patch domain-containing protein n=1 Tax=Aspergillus nanangensis TaxID=2582783 RepID=A0AAD4GXU7_ASPNN|nr:hypothetical protein FE257_007711 [Aspergillus nanangensis]
MPPHQTPAQDDDSDEEDYMSMIIEEPQQKETFSQKKRREQREAEARGRVPSKSELAAQEATRRDEALRTSTLNPSNKGFQMMAKLGFKPGQTLGKRVESGKDSREDVDATPQEEKEEDESGSGSRRAEPLNLVFKEGRGGIGLDSEKKRKFREEADEAVKKVKQEQGDYRDRVRVEREMRRAEAQFHAAQKVTERLDAEEGKTEINTEPLAPSGGESPADGKEGRRGSSSSSSSAAAASSPGGGGEDSKTKKVTTPTARINILYRGLVREREEKERSIQARHLLQSSLPSSFFPSPRLPGFDDSTLEREDKEALGNDRPDLSSILEQEIEEEDPELDEFNALDPGERLARIVRYLREKHRYCFWCKYRYETDEMEGCPGITEEDHD